ncbi:DEAD/DEAH box helicase [Bacillus cereus]
MKIDKAVDLMEKLEEDVFTQNLIAQGDSRYILFSVKESIENFPKYHNELDEKLTSVALSYLSIGCSIAESGDLKKASKPLEKGANILENIYVPEANENGFSLYFALTSSLAFYAARQYSKSFIALKQIKIEKESYLYKLLSCFLKRDFLELSDVLNGIFLDKKINGARKPFISAESQDELNEGIYTQILAKSVALLLEFIYSGNEEYLEKTKEYLDDLLELLKIDEEPALWWMIRLLKIIIDGFYHNSLWRTIPLEMGHFDERVNKYILNLAFQEKPIVELFASQKAALPKVLSPNGAVISIPTSSGKTRIAEIAILQTLITNPNSLVLYLAPFRSLAFEIEESLSKIFSPLGFQVTHLYGGAHMSNIDEILLEESNVVVATPEKAKAILRANEEIKEKIRLVIIDEGHLLGNSYRELANEMFIEELRYHIYKNEGKIVLLSAILPNSTEMAKWLTSNGESEVKSTWKPSAQRFGLLEYNGKNVTINWKGEIESFNRNFITPFWVKRPRSQYMFPQNKKQAIAAAAIKMSSLGSVLVFVGRKNMVLSQAREILVAMENAGKDHKWTCEHEWNLFKLICKELNEEDILHFAESGIVCHHGGLPNELRILVEKLIRKGNPKIIVSTATLGQGVNIGVSTVIVANVWLNQDTSISHNDFWNIAGRAGRSFVDKEGKILYVIDTSMNERWKISRQKELAENYFKISNQTKVESGILMVIEWIIKVANQCEIQFDYLLQLISENDFSIFNNEYKEDILDVLDYIDDTLLALNLESCNMETLAEDFFRKMLAFIQASSSTTVNEEDVISILEARTKGILKQLKDVDNSKGLITSSIPLRSGLYIKDHVSTILEILKEFQESNHSIEEVAKFLREIEILVTKFPSKQFKIGIDPTEIEVIRNTWIGGRAISELKKENPEIIGKYYQHILPWAINAIAKVLKSLELVDEAKEFEQLSALIQLGLPNIYAAKIYSSGLYSRVAATELSTLIDSEILERSIKEIREYLTYKSTEVLPIVSENTKEWLELFTISHSKLDRKIYVPEISGQLKLTLMLTAKSEIFYIKKHENNLYLCNPDYSEIIEIPNDESLHYFSNRYDMHLKEDEEGDWNIQIGNPNLTV